MFCLGSTRNDADADGDSDSDDRSSVDEIVRKLSLRERYHGENEADEEENQDCTHMESIITLVELMLDTKLPCFKPGCVQRLRERFFPDKSEADAALAMSGVMLKAFSLIPFYTGYYYDVFQKISQGISF
jgi:hypothetical protein